MIIGGMTVLEVRAMLRDRKEHQSFVVRFITRPSTALWVLFLPTSWLVRVDLGGTNVPDILTTTLLLCCLGYLCLILPLGLLVVSWRLSRWLWALGRRSGFLAGVLGTLGLVFASCPPMMCATADGDGPTPPRFKKVSEAFDQGSRRAAGKDAIDGSRAFLGALAEVIEAPSSKPSTPPAWPAKEGDKDLFDECIDKLSRGGSNSLRARKISAFVYRWGTDLGSAEDIVHEAVLKLCLRHAKEPYQNLEAVFHLRAEDRRKNWNNMEHRHSRCTRTIQEIYGGDDPAPATESNTIDRALCSLRELDRRILELDAMDYDSKEVGRQLELEPATVRQRKRRALEQVRRRLGAH